MGNDLEHRSLAGFAHSSALQLLTPLTESGI